MIIPKRTRYRKYHKGRACRVISDTVHLCASFGIQACRPGRVKADTLEATRRAINRTYREGRIKLRVVADIPVTSKPAEVRMGKGKGQPSHWIVRVIAGQILFEMDGFTHKLAQKAAVQAARRLNLPIRLIQFH